jgi:polar amino acid transport system substrate-binding protein
MADEIAGHEGHDASPFPEDAPARRAVQLRKTRQSLCAFAPKPQPPLAVRAALSFDRALTSPFPTGAPPMKLAASLGLALGLISTAAWAELPDLQGKEITIVTENAYPPLQFLDKDGKAIGWEYDAIAEIAKKLNLTVKYETISWDAMIPAVSEGQFDMGMTGITITDERKEKVDFSAPYMRSESIMLVRGDESRFTDAASFAANPDLLVGAQPGTTPFYTAVYSVLDGNEQNPRIKLMETFGATVEALKAGDVDTVLTDMTAGKGYVESSGGALKLVGEPLGAEDFGFIFPKGSDLVAPMDAAIEALKADGTFEALNKKWFLDYKMN